MASFWTKRITSPISKSITFFVLFCVVGGIGFLTSKSIENFPIVSTRFIMEENLKNKKIAIIISFRDFQDEEYFIPKKILEKRGAEVTTVSTQRGKAIGSEGGETEVNLTLLEIEVPNFDAVLFIGGEGAPKYLDNETSYKIARETISENKILGAICIAPTILAKAGVLSDKKATVWSSVLNKKPIKILEENGAEYQDRPVVIDENVVTADSAGSAKRFTERVISVMVK